MIQQLTNPWVRVADQSKSLAMTIKFAMDVGGITAGRDVTDSTNSTKKRMTISRFPIYPPSNFQTSFQGSLALILMHLSLLPHQLHVIDVLKPATSKKTVTLLFKVFTAVKYVIGRNGRSSIALTSICPPQLLSNKQTR